MRRTLACALATSLLACLCIVPAHAAGARFTIVPDTLRADEDGTWHASVRLANDGELGVYPDSLTLEQWSLDPDSSMTARHQVRSLDGLVRIMSPAGAGEASGFEWTAPAEFMTGRLRFTILAHDAAKNPIRLTSDVVVTGSDFDDANPSRIVGTPGTELIVMPAENKPAPAIVVVLAPGVSARSQTRWARGLHQRGYAVVLVSAPGWGRSKGTSDRSGLADVTAADAGVRTALAEPGIDPARVTLWGLGRGATTALLTATKHPSLAGIVAIDGALDPTTEYQTLKGDEREEFARVMGKHAARWKDRSPVAQATRIAAPVLIVQTDEAPVRDPAPATEFVARRTAAKLFVESRIHGNEANPIRRRDAQRLALDFIARRTGKSGK